MQVCQREKLESHTASPGGHLSHSYRFGQIEIRSAERQILIDGQPANVGARAFDVLLALIERRDRVVSKDELLELVWPGLVVEENNLQVQVSTLRKLLGPQAITTIAGRGYQFTLKFDSDSGEAPAPAAHLHNLPVQLNSFVGREREIGEIKDILGTSRLVTLTSMGGTGKTRLSLQVAADVMENYPDGVWFVELAPLADARLAPQAVASVLGVKEEAGRPVLEALEKYVKNRRLLLVLDNCEHLVQACAELAKKLLKAGHGLHILASSREYLHVAGEMNYPVPPLAVPAACTAANEAIDLEALTQYEAVRLFTDRATAIQPAFQVTAKNAAAVADICRRLDGIPLAIELAAARVGALSVENIAARLSDRFSLLTGGDNTASLRQKTLRASIDWSYDLLSPPERTLLQRLAVFAGGWTLEAAEAVGAGSGKDQPAVLDLLIQLVEKSLVTMEAGGERYHLLDTVREYALERLRESGEENAVRTHHLDYYLAFAEKARPELAGPEQGVWLAWLDVERENLLVAHTWAGSAPEGAILGLRLTRALKPYWINRGLLGLGLSVTLVALGRKGAESSIELCGGLFDAGQINFVMGRNAEAEMYLKESLAIAKKLRDPRWIAAALQPLGMVYLVQGDKAAAREHFEEALMRVRTLGRKREIAAALIVLAQLLRMEGELDTAERHYAESLELARELQDRETIAIGFLNLAMVSIERGNGDQAAPMLSDALAITKEIGSKRLGQSAFDVAAGLAASLGDWSFAARFYGAAEAQALQAGIRRDPSDDAFLAPRITTARTALAADEFATAEAEGRALEYQNAITELRAWLEKCSCPQD